MSLHLPILAVLSVLPPLRGAESTIDSAIASCVWIRAENDASGAGFIIDRQNRRIVTCRHVVADRDVVDVYFPWFRDGRLITEKAEYLGHRACLRDRGLLVVGKVVKKSDAADLALIELPSMPLRAAAITLRNQPVPPGDSLLGLGHRLDLDTLFNATRGSVRQAGRLTEGYHWRGKKLAANADVAIAQLPVEEGDSGGPVFDSRGELIGMVSALRRQTPTAAVVISSAEIRKFLERADPKPQVEQPGLGDKLIRATVWLRPTATDFHTAGVLIDRHFVLTSNRGIGARDRLGIAFPLFEKGKPNGERAPYRDPVALYLKRAWRHGLVVARDPVRDLALVRIFDGIPEAMAPLSLAERPPRPGDAIHAMSHPGGLEFAWVYSSGSIRQRGRIALEEGEHPARADAFALQLPAQAGSPGGPVVNDRGELIGVLAARESAQQTGYAATIEEVAAFLDEARTDRPAKTLPGLLSRLALARDRFIRLFAECLAASASQKSSAGHTAEAERTIRLAIEVDPDCSRARHLLLAFLVKPEHDEAFGSELDRLVDRADAFPGDVFIRAVRRMKRQEWRLARADLERILEILPQDVLARRRLVTVLLELKKDDLAAAAVGDAIRTAPEELRFLAPTLLAQAESLAQKFPDTPSAPANWLQRALAAASGATTDPTRKTEIQAALRAADDAREDADRLAILRRFLQKQGK